MITPAARRTVEDDLLTLLAGATASDVPGTAVVLLGERGHGATTLVARRLPALLPDAVVVRDAWHPHAPVQLCARPAELPAQPPAPGEDGRPPALVVACERLDQLPDWLREGAHYRSEVLTVGGLSLAELHDFCAVRLGGSVDLGAAQALGEAAGLVPGSLASLVEAARRAGALARVDGVWQLIAPLDGVLAGWARPVLSAMDDDTARLAFRLALAEPALERLLGAEEARTVARLLEDGVLRRQGDGRLVFRAPGLAAALRDLAPPELATRVHRETLAAGRATPPAVRWALTHGEPAPEETVDAAIEGALERHEWPVAAELAELALVGVPAPARSCELHLRAAYAWRFVPDTDEAGAHLDEAAGLATGLPPKQAEHAITRIAVARAELLHYDADDLDGALLVLEGAAQRDASRARIAELRARQVLHLTYGGRPVAAAALLAEHGGELRSAPRGLRTRVRIAEALQASARGRPRRALGRLARTGARVRLLRRDEPWVDEELRAAYFQCAVTSDGPAAHPQLVRHLEDTRDGVYRPDTVTFHLARASWALLRGEVTEAHRIAALSDAVARYADPSGMARVLAALLAETSALRGLPGEAETHLARASRLPVRSSATVAGGTEAHLAAARLLLGQASAAEALRERALAFTQEGAFGFAAELLHAGVRLGRRRAAAALVELEAHLDGELHAMRVAHARAVLARDPVGLLAAADRFRAAGLRLLAAEAAALAAGQGGTPDHPGDGGVRQRARLAARRDAEELGLDAHPLLRPLRHRGEDQRLTPREREVAELIAAGLSNREIALRLRLSPRTVEGHVARLYRKTGGTRRSPARRS